MIGNVEMTLANGKVIEGEFTARIIISLETSGKLRIKKYQVWTVRTSYFKFS